MASYPGSIFSPRAVANRAGVVYDADKTKVFFAKDHNDFGKEIVAIENALGVDFPFNWPMKITGTLTRDSEDDPSYVLKIADVDWTAKLSLGMRIKWTQNSTVRYGIITKLSFSTHTYITIYGGTDYDMLNSTTYPITDCFISTAKAPLGFPLDPAKWTVEITDTANTVQSSVSAGIWYNINSNSITIPVGCWNIGYLVKARVARIGSTYSNNLKVTLSTANNSESTKRYTRVQQFRTPTSGATDNLSTFTMENEFLTLSAKDTYYFNLGADATGTNLSLDGAVIPLVVKAICAYL